jgi:hypothetical protein
MNLYDIIIQTFIIMVLGVIGSYIVRSVREKTLNFKKWRKEL